MYSYLWTKNTCAVNRLIFLRPIRHSLITLTPILQTSPEENTLFADLEAIFGILRDVY